MCVRVNVRVSNHLANKVFIGKFFGNEDDHSETASEVMGVGMCTFVSDYPKKAQCMLVELL